jgi:orotidine-5'-phosphate decarboxylase
MASLAPMLDDEPSMTRSTNARERLIVALDLADAYEAWDMVQRLEGVVDFFKVGLTLQLATGTQKLIDDLICSGRKVFLDYKYYDIAETLRKTVARAAKIGVSFLTVHGSSILIKAAVEGRGDSPLKLFTVTVLTNLDKSDMAEMGYPSHTVEDLVLFRTRKAIEAGCDGVIASGQEAMAIKELSKQMSKNLLVITPGIRPDGHLEDDQKRRVTPAKAIEAGADYLVIGRPITESMSPRESAKLIISEMQAALDSMASR